MKNNQPTRIAALTVALATLTLTSATLADQEDEQGLETVGQSALDMEAAPLGLMSDETRTIDGTGLRLRAMPGQETDTIDGTGLRPLASDGTETIDGTGRLHSTPNIDLAASGQTLRTLDSVDSDDCEVPAGVNAATSNNCEPETD